MKPVLPDGWICDSCNKFTDDPQKGVVEWLEKDDGAHRFVIIHTDCDATSCWHPNAVEGSTRHKEPLANFVGDRGLWRMLCFFRLGRGNGMLCADVRDWLDLFRRLFVLNYEVCRDDLIVEYCDGVGLAEACKPEELATLVEDVDAARKSLFGR